MGVLVCQISRGIAPVVCIVEAVEAAHRHGATYRYVTGLPAPEAKDRAVDLALESGADLILCEDDMLATDDQWERAICGPSDKIRLASAPCRNGVLNTVYDRQKRVMWSGTVLIGIPFDILCAIAAQGRPTFQAWDIIPDMTTGELCPCRPNGRGEGSDVYLWWRISQLDPRPDVDHIGTVVCLETPLNTGPKRLNQPVELSPVRLRA